MTDPFSDDFVPPQPQGFAWESASNETNSSQDNNVKGTNMQQEHHEGKITVTLKGGRDFDAPWIVIHADDAEDALATLSEPSMRTLIERTREIARVFAGSTQPGPQRGNDGQKGRPAGATQPPNGETPTCAHGQMIYRSGISRSTGKAYEGYFCPLPYERRAEQCRAQYL